MLDVLDIKFSIKTKLIKLIKKNLVYMIKIPFKFVSFALFGFVILLKLSGCCCCSKGRIIEFELFLT